MVSNGPMPDPLCNAQKPRPMHAVMQLMQLMQWSAWEPSGFMACPEKQLCIAVTRDLPCLSHLHQLRVQNSSTGHSQAAASVFAHAVQSDRGIKADQG